MKNRKITGLVAFSIVFVLFLVSALNISPALGAVFMFGCFFAYLMGNNIEKAGKRVSLAAKGLR